MNRHSLPPALAALALLLSATLAGGTPADLVQEARARAAARDAEGAVTLYREVAAHADADLKTRVQAFHSVADLYANTLGRIEEALATYDALIALDGISTDDKLTARNRKAGLLMRLRTRERAIEMRTIWADIGRDESLTPAQRIQGWINVANNAAASTVYANLDEARDALAQAFAIPELTDADRAQIEAQGILFALTTRDLVAAADYAQRILDAPGSTGTQKQNAYYQLAGVRLREGDETAADQTVRLGLARPDLTEAQKAAALFDIGRLNARMNRYAAAREAFAEAARLDPPQAAKAETALAAAWMAEGDFDAACKIHLDAGRVAEAAAVRQAQGDIDAALALCRTAFDNPEAAAALRWSTLSRYIDICNAANRFDDAQAVLDRYEALPGSTASHYRGLMNLLRNAMTRTVYGFAAEAADLLCRNAALVGDDAFFARLYRVNALAGAGDAAAAAAAADAFAQDTQLPPDRRFCFALTQALLAAPDHAVGTKATIATVESAFARDKLAPDKRQDALLRAGRTAMIAGRFETAKAVGLYYDSLFVPEPVKTYTVAFMPKAPASIDGFLASSLVANPALRGVFDRKFGGNLELVAATDVSTGDRGDISIAAGSKGDTDTAFLAVCDADGIHIFFDAKDDRTPEVEAGLLRGGSFEGYIAAGERAPHTCFLVNLQSGKVTLWNSAYATEQHTPVTTDSAAFRSEFRHTKDAHLLYLFFGWELFHDKLPGGDEFWLFETARWARGGRVTWNGLKTVHGRSSFGHWRFALSDADRSKIKRKLIYKAYARYTEEKNPRVGGLVDFYADKDYSDPAFYAAEVAPLVERLDAFGKRVSATLTDAEADALYTEAVPLWMNIRYRISDLRRTYLERKLTAVK